MGLLKVNQTGNFEEGRWTRIKMVCRSPRGSDYAVERFEPLARAAEVSLRDQVAYFAGLGYRVMDLEVSQTEGFNGRCLKELNPWRHWPPASFFLEAHFPEGAVEAEPLIALMRNSPQDERLAA
jgi:hypothetical protein